MLSEPQHKNEKKVWRSRFYQKAKELLRVQGGKSATEAEGIVATIFGKSVDALRKEVQRVKAPRHRRKK